MSPVQPLPDSLLTNLLQQKVALRTDLNIDLVARLKDLRDQVAAEARYIVTLFPEYTPHDEQYHLTSLFNIAEILIGSDQLGRLNAIELFILASAMYAHDWGMAVSQPEKGLIIEGASKRKADAENFSLLPDEHERFIRFMQERGTGGGGKAGEEVDLSSWSEYVRRTHAFRSGARVLSFFTPIDVGLARAIAKVCESHWLNIEDLDDYESFPPNYAVLRETVNLRALAVYLRLVDLFDLAADRTPYVIWKYVAPRDPRSKLEWAKHRAVQSVSAQQYQDGRVLQVDGTTDDVEVYAALKDLEAYCERELRACVHLLARTNDPRHAVNIYHSNWRIQAVGFKPIAIRFDFARDRMFQILGDEIYGGDSYVFLRELLQNSIDAIRMRREVLQRNNADPALERINVTVTQDENKDMVISWTDNGIGMDEYIIRNYLAMAGRSYYQSDDFKKFSLQLDPIARFGIGLLSCFAVAERIQIKTKRDPYMESPSEALSVDIPAFERYFRVETSAAKAIPIGTTVTVFVDRRKLPLDDSGQSIELQVTEYLQRVAGFCEIPIVVDDLERRTVITRPENPTKVRVEEPYNVVTIPLDYPLDLVIFGGTGEGRAALEEESYDLANDLGLRDFEGRLVFLRLTEAVGDVVKGDYERAFNRFLPVDYNGDTLMGFEVLRIYDVANEYYGPSLMDAIQEMKIPLEEEFPGVIIQSLKSLSPSAWCSPFYRVYRDGVLLSSVSPPLSFQIWSERSQLPVPSIAVNIPKSKAPRVDLARSRILDSNESWDVPIANAFQAYLREKRLPTLLDLHPAERLQQLARWSVTYRLSEEALWEMVPAEKWPVAFLDKGLKMLVRDWAEVKDEEVRLLDDRIELNAKRLVSALYGDASTFPKLPDEYFPVALRAVTDTVNVSGNRPLLAEIAFRLSFKALKESHVLTEVKTAIVDLTQYSDAVYHHSNGQLFVQKVLNPKKPRASDHTIVHILTKALNSPAALEPEEFSVLSQGIKNWPAVVKFPDAIHQMFVLHNMMNLLHPLTPILLKLIAHVEIAKRRNPNDAEKYAAFMFMWDALSINSLFVDTNKLNRLLMEIRNLAIAQGLPTDGWEDSLKLSQDEVRLDTTSFYRL